MTTRSDGELKKVLYGSIGSVIVAFVLGTIAMIYSADKNNEVFATKLEFISSNMLELKNELKIIKEKYDAVNYDRWTRSDHDEYDKFIQQRFFTIEKRLLKIEHKK